jgi:hypothetical protein
MLSSKGRVESMSVERYGVKTCTSKTVYLIMKNKFCIKMFGLAQFSARMSTLILLVWIPL